MFIYSVNNVIEKARRKYIWGLEVKNINKKTNLYKNVVWTTNQQKEFDEYWLTYYGKKISNKWHKLYESINGEHNIEYFPEGLYTSDFEPNVNRIDYCRVLRDKSFLQTMYADTEGVTIPNNYLLFSGRYCYDSQQHIISKEYAIEVANNIGEAVIKPTVLHGSGRNIIVVNFRNGKDLKTGKSVKAIIDSYSTNFCIQECLKAHESYSLIYPESINTIKILTYILNGSIYHDPISLRIGSGGSWIDNIHAGGFCIGVDESGKLGKYAYRLGYGDSNEKTVKHPDTGYLYESGSVYGIQSIIDCAYRLHGRTPNIGAIAWDFCINSDGKPVLIEANFNGNSAWFPQVVNSKPLFGENTKAVLLFLKSLRKGTQIL